MSTWFDEVHQGARFGLEIKKHLVSLRSEYQQIDVVETTHHGRALALDGLWMTAEADEATYHEMISHVALTTAPCIRRVLVIGGGDGGTVREVLRHPEVEVVDLVEVDGEVVRACKEHLWRIGTAWDDPRLNLHIADGIAWVAEPHRRSYDVILIDGSDPVGPAEGLFNERFFRHCHARLNPHGVLVTQAESPTVMTVTHLQLIHTLGRVFHAATPYYGPVSIYPGGAWSWVYASDTVSPQELVRSRLAAAEAASSYYNEDVHRGAFAVPQALRRRLRQDHGTGL